MSRLTHRTIEQGVAIGCPYCIDETKAASVDAANRAARMLTAQDLDELRDLADALRQRVEHQRILTRIDDRYESALAVLDKLLAREVGR